MRRLILVAGLTLGVDQLSKSWAQSQGWVTVNSGISFGWLSQGWLSPTQAAVSPGSGGGLLVLLLVVLGLVIWVARPGRGDIEQRETSETSERLHTGEPTPRREQFQLSPSVPLSLFLGGALSNIADRLWLGGVRDWLVIPGTRLYNNLADYAIAVAVIWLILIFWREPRVSA